jgi:hypothetical protein
MIQVAQACCAPERPRAVTAEDSMVPGQPKTHLEKGG